MSVIEQIFGKREEVKEKVFEIPVLCRLWEEDGVWNGEAVDLAVAVFGKTFEETQHNLADAIISHLETLQEIEQLKDTVHLLRTCARMRRVSVDEMPSNQAFWRFSAGLQDEHLVPIA